MDELGARRLLRERRHHPEGDVRQRVGGDGLPEEDGRGAALQRPHQVVARRVRHLLLHDEAEPL